MNPRDEVDTPEESVFAADVVAGKNRRSAK